jgi:hypothetical protein
MFYPLTGTRSSDASGKRMREVACPICTVHLQVDRCYNSFKIHRLVSAWESTSEHGTTNLPCSRSKFQLLVQRRSSAAYASILSSSAPVEVSRHAGVSSRIHKREVSFNPACCLTQAIHHICMESFAAFCIWMNRNHLQIWYSYVVK